MMKVFCKAIVALSLLLMPTCLWAADSKDGKPSLEKLTSMSRRNFLRGAGSAAILPLMPPVPLSAVEAATTVVAAPVEAAPLFQNLMQFFKYEFHSVAMMDPSFRSEFGEFYSVYDRSFEGKLYNGHPTLTMSQWLRWVVPDRFGIRVRETPMMDREAGAAKYISVLQEITNTVGREGRYTPEFLTTQSESMVNLIHGLLGELSDQVKAYQQGPPSHEVLEFRKHFMKEFKKQLPDFYRRQLHVWAYSMQRNPYDARTLSDLGFEPEDLRRYLQLSGHSDLKAIIRSYEEVGRHQPPEDYPEMVSEDLNQARSQLIGMIRARAFAQAEAGCEHLLETPKEPVYLSADSQDEAAGLETLNLSNSN